MSKRLQVLVPDDEMESLQRQAANEHLTVGEYVRLTLREAESNRPVRSAKAKLAAIREAAKFSFPAPDMDQMNREIEQGYLS